MIAEMPPEAFYSVNLKVVILSDNNPEVWGADALFAAIEKQYLEHQFKLEIEEVA
jgi:hypothetical protein